MSSSSPPSYKYKSFSPIRDLEQKYSPTKRGLDVILQESNGSRKSPSKYKYYDAYRSVSGNEGNMSSNSSAPLYTDAKMILVENNRLKNDNQILASSRNYASLTYAKELERKDSELESLRRELMLVQDKLEKENMTLSLENENLRKSFLLLESQKADEIALLRLKYSTMPEEQKELIRKGYTDDIAKALTDLEAAHKLIEQKEIELQHLSTMCKQNSYEYGLNLEDLISANNILKGKLAQFEMQNEREIQEITNKKELEKSRTQGIISYCKENTLFIEKQIIRLADELLKKNISIESFNREVTKYQRLIEEQEKRNSDEVYRLRKDFEETLSEKERTIEKLEKQFKLDLAEKKKIEMELVEKISSIENQVDSLNKKLEHANQVVDDKRSEIRQLKEVIERKEDDHAKEISKVMSNSRIGRKSMKNISSYSSFKDIDEPQGSSIIKSGKLKRQQSLANNVTEGEDGTPILPTVHEEDKDLAHSQAMGAMGEMQEEDAKELILHYESLIEELKKNKMTELSIANNKIEGLKQSLNEKQQQILDILNRFSPLMEYKIEKESIDEERRRKIEEHHKGDIDILSVMLDKYSIVALRSAKDSRQ